MLETCRCANINGKTPLAPRTTMNCEKLTLSIENAPFEQIIRHPHAPNPPFVVHVARCGFVRGNPALPQMEKTATLHTATQNTTTITMSNLNKLRSTRMRMHVHRPRSLQPRDIDLNCRQCCNTLCFRGSYNICSTAAAYMPKMRSELLRDTTTPQENRRYTTLSGTLREM